MMSNVVKSNLLAPHIARAKGRLTEPIAHVDIITSLSEWLQFLNEQIDVSADDTLLLEQGLLGEGVSEGAALAGMVGVVCHGESC